MSTKQRCPSCGWTNGKHPEPCPVDINERVDEARAAERVAIVAEIRTYAGRCRGVERAAVMAIADRVEGSDGVERKPDERKAIVAWLRAHAFTSYATAADAIEAGAHLDDSKGGG